MKIAKKISTILCDDVRYEVGNKMSLMGVYSKDIVFIKVPSVLPLLSLVIMFQSINIKFKELHLTVITPKTGHVNHSFPAPPDLKLGQNLNFVISLSPFKVDGKGNGKLEIRFDKDQKPGIIHNFEIKTTGEI